MHFSLVFALFGLSIFAFFRTICLLPLAAGISYHLQCSQILQKHVYVFCTALFVCTTPYQKKSDVHKISARNSGAGNGCANFMGAWRFWALSAGKPHAHKISPFRGGGVVGFLEGGGGSADFIFMGVGIFPTLVQKRCDHHQNPTPFPPDSQHPHCLRGPAAILFISRDACSDSIAKLSVRSGPGKPNQRKVSS